MGGVLGESNTVYIRSSTEQCSSKKRCIEKQGMVWRGGEPSSCSRMKVGKGPVRSTVVNNARKKSS